MKIGIFALGSHEEDHGAALPTDTDARIAEYIARDTAENSDSKFLGTFKTAYELPEIETGGHQPLKEVVREIKEKINKAGSRGFDSVLIVNAHGGNQEVEKHLGEIEKETDVKVRMDSYICQNEGPHAGTGELSVGKVIGFVDEERLSEHTNFEQYPEVGFVGFNKVRSKYGWAEEHAQEVINDGVEIDEDLGRKLVDSSVESAIEKVRKLRE